MLCEGKKAKVVWLFSLFYGTREVNKHIMANCSLCRLKKKCTAKEYKIISGNLKVIQMLVNIYQNISIHQIITKTLAARSIGKSFESV